MATRRVTATKKDDEGDILALCNDGEDWSPRWKSQAISDIEDGDHRYYVEEEDYRTYVEVKNPTVGDKYLRTEEDETSANNLDNLPPC